MNLYRRAWISITCQLGNFAILAVSVFLLAILLSGALSVRQAVTNADTALRAQMPAVATLGLSTSDEDWEIMVAHYEQAGELPGLTASHIREIGSLEYVDAFDFLLVGRVYSSELARAFDEEKFAHIDMPDEFKVDFDSLSNSIAGGGPESWKGTYFWESANLEHFSLMGVQNSDILDVRTGLIELVGGRTFEQRELESLSYVAVVSDEFLKANNLDLGGFVSFDQKEFIDDFRELIYSQPIQLEIVGVFNREFIPEDHPEQEDVQQYFNQINQVYVPAIVVESLTETFWEVLLEHDPEVYLEASAHREAEAPYHHGPVLFSLHDPVHLAPFREAAEEILPDFWLVDDFTNTYLLISASMEMVDEMALWIVIGVSIATAVIVALVILLFLHDRRFEVGVYLALGERKFRAIGQLVVEIMIATILGMTLGLLVGNMLSAEVSTMMIEQDMVRQLEDSERGIAGVAPALHWAGYRAHMTPEEMMEIYEIGLEVRTVIQFYALFLTAATFASVVSLWSITKMKPRELLSTLS